MTLLDSLLDAIVRLDGDALVMHVGEKPYVVTTSSAMSTYRGPLAWGQVELSSRVLTPDAVLSMVGQILPADQRHALEEVGAVEHQIASPAGVADRFSVVAARGGDDIWLELRRHPSATQAPAPAAAEAAQAAATTATAAGQAAAAVGLEPPPAAPPDVASDVRAPREQEQSAAGPSTESDSTGDEVQVDEPHVEIELVAQHEEIEIDVQRDEAHEEAGREEHPDDRHSETRVPILDEVTHEDAEHVEHFVIPVDGADEAEVSQRHADAAMELIEPEPQYAPTEDDVDAMLAATAASMLAANLKSDAPEAEADSDQEHEEIEPAFTPDSFEVVLEEGEAESDLTSALDEMPAAPWSAGAPVATQPAEPAALSTAAEPDVTPAAAEAGREAAAAESAPERSETPEAAAEPPSATPDELLDEEQPIQTEMHVDTTAALPVPPGKAPSHAEPKIAASVIPIDRASGRAERPDAGGRVDDERLLQMLRVAAERGASTVYVVAQSKPMMRVDGEIAPLDSESVLTAAEIDKLVSALAPSRPSGAAAEAGVEWISEVPQIGRVRCVTFRDHRGPGLIFRLTSATSISAEHLNVSPAIRELCTLADGLVIVAGARGSGKSTLLNSFVDLINRTRSEHVITVETEIGFAHESRRSFISQREVGEGTAAAAVNAALREDPDVLVIEDVQAADIAIAALHAAESGRLVFASINASSSVSALEAFVNLAPEPERASVRAALAGALRAVATQLLLRKASGGRVTARELLLNSPSIAASVRNGDAKGVAAGLEAGERYGMVSLNDAIAGLVRSGTVHAAEGYRRSPDRQALLASLQREGVDTSFAERMAVSSS